MLDRFSPPVLVAVATALWFFVEGVIKVSHQAPSGRRAAVLVPRWRTVLTRVRGVIEMVAAIGVGIGAVLGFLDLKLGAAYPAAELGWAVSVLALWTAVESLRPPLRPVRIVLAILGFALAVFYLGFR
ncbi:hypothetical protein ATK74_1887 [Propionicimonas paludicola]|uniref:DoxX-like protein n=1 Tax=Propionicimonas paludicola TaxID=185243 RepID=A0A2A9CUL7_9ACTN|nr:hypothetical protein [Propionicimonas paludicola]PFG17320.1 hypothetical protein ATK74_1887 [Propionicimonas paludicola]